MGSIEEKDPSPPPPSPRRCQWRGKGANFFPSPAGPQTPICPNRKQRQRCGWCIGAVAAAWDASGRGSRRAAITEDETRNSVKHAPPAETRAAAADAIHGLDPIPWTLSERWIGCPGWLPTQAKGGGHADGS